MNGSENTSITQVLHNSEAAVQALTRGQPQARHIREKASKFSGKNLKTLTKHPLYISKKIFRDLEKLVFIFFLLLNSPKELSKFKDNTILNTKILQIYVSLIIINNFNKKILEIL